MKKKTLLLLLIIFPMMSFMQHPPVPSGIGGIRGIRITLQVAWEDGEDLGTDVPQSPAPTQIPTVSIDGRTLYFYDVFSSTVPVVIVDSNDEVVFSDYLYCGADKIMLPASLTGTFTVYMRVGTILYYGTFNV